MRSSSSALSNIPDADLKDIWGGHVRTVRQHRTASGSSACARTHGPDAACRPGTCGAMVKGAVLGGMDHCIDHMSPIGPSMAPTNLNIVALTHPYQFGQVKYM